LTTDLKPYIKLSSELETIEKLVGYIHLLPPPVPPMGGGGFVKEDG